VFLVVAAVGAVLVAVVAEVVVAAVVRDGPDALNVHSNNQQG
jgi:hypothetical protein